MGSIPVLAEHFERIGLIKTLKRNKKSVFQISCTEYTFAMSEMLFISILPYDCHVFVVQVCSLAHSKPLFGVESLFLSFMSHIHLAPTHGYIIWDLVHGFS